MSQVGDGVAPSGPKSGVTQSPLLTVQGLSKTFPGVRALNDVDMTVNPAEILALVGHNGSGKSTLVKVLAGVYRPDAGATIDLDGEIHFIHQDLGLVPMLNTIENLGLGSRLGWRALAPTRGRERELAQASIGRVGGHFDVAVPISEITPAERTIVAIARATASWTADRNVLVLDEPTATLHGEEADRLRTVIKALAASGTGIIFVSHHLDEVLDLADRAVVLRDGEVILSARRGEFDYESLVAAISGHASAASVLKKPGYAPGPTRLRVSRLRASRIRNFDLDARAGEVVGLSGLVGSGMEQALGTIFGALGREAGAVEISGRAVKPASPSAAMRAGMGFVPADRRRHGAILAMTAGENMTLCSLSSIRGALGGINKAREHSAVATQMDAVAVRPADPNRAFALFSGGNQQKIVIAKWLRRKPSVLLFDEPTQGVDVGAQAGIYRLILDAAADGAAIVIASSDEDELVTVCDRVLIMRDGLVTDELVGDDVTKFNIIHATLGASAGMHQRSKEAS